MEGFSNWSKVLMNDLPLTFLLEVIMRTAVMFFIILLTLRASGKRGIKQLSVFELVLIIGLGSAAGDPMFYEDVGILPALTVFIVILILYLIVTRLADKFTTVEKVLEGVPLYLLHDGIIDVEAFKKSGLSQDEFFGQLRNQNIEHLGQVRKVLLETSGDLSILYFSDDKVVAGLPIFPDQQHPVNLIGSVGTLACCRKCGKTYQIPALPDNPRCHVCNSDDFVSTLSTTRIS